MPNPIGTAGNDLLAGAFTADTIEGLAGNDTLQGAGGNDTLLGGSGNDVLNGGIGNDSMAGGTGNDAYHVQQVGDTVVEGAGAGIDTVYSYLAAYTLGAHLENLRILSAGAASATGNGLNNVIFAGAGDNLINGGAGRDTVSYLYAASGVTVSLAVAGAHATGGSGFDTLLSIENLTGSTHDDSLTGSAASNTLDGGLGIDTLSGGDGSDTYRVNNSADTVVETNANSVTGGIDLVLSTAAAFTLAANVENLRILANGAADGTGNALGNVLFAGAGDNLLNGMGGVDTASYRHASGGVVVSLATGAAQATVNSGSDTLLGFENLEGSAYDDELYGDFGNNHLDGGLGADTLSGSDGNDTYRVDSIDDAVVEYADDGYDTVHSIAAAYRMADNVEAAIIVTTAAADLTGNAQDNLLYAGAGDNVLDGDAGYDTVSYQNAAGAVSVSLMIAGPQATGGSGTDTLANIDALTGSSFADSLTGGNGANVLDGLAGNDTMTGGLGDDTYWIDASGDLAIEELGGGYDRAMIATSSGWTAGANIERISIITTTTTTSVTGNSVANLFESAGGTWMSYFDGGGGQDTLSYATSGSGITLNLGNAGGQATGGSGTDTVLNMENLIGSGYNDSLTGSTGANDLDGGFGNDTLNGGAGNDTLDGGNGNDTLAGGTGDDLYYALSGTDTIVEAAGEGTDTVHTAFSMTLSANVENAVIASGGAVNVTGNSGHNTIYAGSGNNSIAGDTGTDAVSYAYAGNAVSVSLAIVGAQQTLASGFDTLSGIENLAGSNYNDTLTGSTGANVLNGGIGADSMSGGAGNDTYYVDAVGDTVTEAFDAGIDTVLAGVSHTLANNVEYLRINSSGSVNGTGNILDNVIYAGSGDNVINGGSGSDTVSYFYAGSGVNINLAVEGSPQNTLGSGFDTLSSIERVNGSGYNDTLLGGGGHQALNGGSGNDSINGGANGEDTLTGGFGNDTFRFTSDLGFDYDIITDMNNGNDTISLDLDIYTQLSAGVLPAAYFVTGVNAVDANDYIVYDTSTGALYYDADGSGAGAKVQIALLADKAALSASDFVVAS